MKIKMTIKQLLFLLNEQRTYCAIEISNLIRRKHQEGEINTETIFDEIRKVGSDSPLPADVEVLIKYGRK